ncbi:hypothetical protein PCK1_000176 [Pneumocystis canis]|nr:hypothetical protein PCK1_000176 [Pneumocystis canis]
MFKHWSSHDEEEVRRIFLKILRTTCSDKIQKFAECATGKTFSALWKCRLEKKQMKECIRLNTLPNHYDCAREIYMKSQLSRETHEKV